MKLDVKHLLNENIFADYQEKVTQINKMINEKTGKGNDYLGWADYPLTYDKEEVKEIKKWAQHVRDNFEVLVVCGIGGSYLGARSVIEALNGLYKNDKLEIIFLGNTFSPNYTAQVLEYIKNKKFAINVISKSGTTTETSIAFRLVKALLEEKVGLEEARKAIFATTDKEKGALKTLCNNEGYVSFILPSDVGGRFSVFTAVGLFPIACAGLDIDEFLAGSLDAYNLYNNDDLTTNTCYRYALSRDYMYRHGKAVELYVQYEPHLVQISEWLKQLFGESEGKEKKGLLPDSVCFSTDLHSLGQFIQDGSPVLFETIIRVTNPKQDIVIPHDDLDLDGLNYLEGKNLAFVNEKAYEGTLKAHVEEGGVPCMTLSIETLNERSLGHLLYFFMRACAMSAYLLDINPFNQPGVEVYKRNMFHLLGKKGY